MANLKRNLSRLSVGLLALLLVAAVAACVQPATEVKPAAQMKAPAPAVVKQAAPKAVEAAPKVVAAAPRAVEAAPAGAALYQTEPTPLTAVQCGQCHTGIFRYLKNDGGRHRFECQNCHQEFHAYSPKKQNWDDLMPKCSSCHTLPHGKQFTDCLSCHQNPHTPRKVPMAAQLTGNCGNCHTSPAAQLKQFPSKHTQQGCQACHTSHGLIPSCFNCHEPHFEAQAVATCTTCHPVHKPLQIDFAGDIELKTCSGCHETVYNTWSGSKSKHGQVSCASCHTQHGLIPKCNDCHGWPHSKKLHDKFTSCLTCHLDPHDPPVKTK